MDDRRSEEERELLEELKRDLERHFACDDFHVLWTAQNMTWLAKGESTSDLLKDGHELYVVFPSETLAGPNEEVVRQYATAIASTLCTFADSYRQLTGHDRVGTVRFASRRDAHGMPLLFLGLTPAA